MKNKIIYNIPYFMTPNEIFEMDDINIYEQMVYIYLCRCGNNSGSAFPSYQTIADKCKMSKRNAIKCVKSLVDKGYIQKQIRHGEKENKSNLYYVNVDIISENKKKIHSEHDAPPIEQDAPNKEININKNIKDLHHPSEDDGFLQLLNDYCQKRFNKPIRKFKERPNLDEIEDLTTKELKIFLDRNIKDYRECNVDYLSAIKHRARMVFEE